MKEEISEIEKKKEYLRGYEKAVRQVERSKLRIEEIYLNRICPSVVNDGMPHVSSQSDLSGYAVLKVQEEKRYLKYRYQCAMKCQEIENKIEQLINEDEKDVLVYRYIRLMKWEEVCVKIGHSWQHTHRIHAQALKNFKM